MALLPNSVVGKSAPFLARVENVLDQFDTLKGEYMAACKAKRADIKQIYKDAKDEDVPVGALKGLVKYRILERKQAAIANDVPDGEASEFEMLVEALGDYASTELGQAALDLAGGDNDEEPTDKPKRGRKAKADAPKESPEEAAALGEIERDGIGGAATGATAN